MARNHIVRAAGDHDNTAVQTEVGIVCWKGEFAKFLKNIGHSSCFKDSLLLTKAECEDTRIFTQKVHLKIYERLLKKVENDTSNDNSVEAQLNENEDRARQEIINEHEGGRRRGLPSIGGFKSLHL